jgi:effector-binding domain-containing protein
MMRPLRAVAIAGLLAFGTAAAVVGSLCGEVFAQAAPQPPAPPPAQADPPPPPPAPPPAASQRAPGDPFGEETTLSERTIVYLKGSGTWDTAYETLIDAFKSVYAFVEKQGLKRAGHSMTIYTSAGDTGFEFQAAVPIEQAPSELPRGDIEVGKTPAGRALKFSHRGSYDSMDATYEAITNHLDEKRLEAHDLFIEEYETDPVTTPEDKLVVNVLVPLR